MNEQIGQRRFTQQPQIRRKIRVFLTAFYTCTLATIFSMGYSQSLGPEEIFYAGVSLISVMLAVLTAAIASLAIRCPRCHRRVYTISLMYSGKMPDRQNRVCPHCGFPD